MYYVQSMGGTCLRTRDRGHNLPCEGRLLISSWLQVEQVTEFKKMFWLFGSHNADHDENAQLFSICIFP
jgi:hypothetical protein